MVISGRPRVIGGRKCRLERIEEEKKKKGGESQIDARWLVLHGG